MNEWLATPTKPTLQTILMTGSSGLIESSFIDRVGESSQEMGFDREGPPHPSPSTKRVIGCDLSSDNDLGELVWSKGDKSDGHSVRTNANENGSRRDLPFLKEPNPRNEL